MERIFKSIVLLLVVVFSFSNSVFAEDNAAKDLPEKPAIESQEKQETQKSQESIEKQVVKKTLTLPAQKPFYVKFNRNFSYNDRAQPFELKLVDNVSMQRGWVLGVVKLSPKTYHSETAYNLLSDDITLVGNIGRTKKSAIFNRGGYYDIRFKGVKVKNGDIYPAKVTLLKVMDNHFAKVGEKETRIQAKGSFWEKAGKTADSKWDLMDYAIAPVAAAIMGVPSVLTGGSDMDLYNGLVIKVELEKPIVIQSENL